MSESRESEEGQYSRGIRENILNGSCQRLGVKETVQAQRCHFPALTIFPAYAEFSV